MAEARVVVDALLTVARAQRMARVGRAFVDVALALSPLVAGRTSAGEIAEAIDAEAAVQARLAFTLVQVLLAALARRAPRAGTREVADQVDADARVLARL